MRMRILWEQLFKIKIVIIINSLYMKRKKLFLLFLLSVSLGITYGQTRVTGSVVNTDGNPVIGASVTIKGADSKLGTLTNEKGKFSLQVPASKKTLVISYVGYKTIEATVKPNVTVTMEQDAAKLGDVVITGEFGIKRVARSVGSDAQNIKGSDISESGRESFVTAMQGRVSGMDVTSTSGTPGSSTTVVLRSATSISGNNAPLYVVDGVPMNNSTYDPLDMVTNASNEVYSVRNMDYSSRGNDINPQDIESVTVLKGAAAAALYG